MLALATGFRAIAPTVEPPTAFMWLAIGAVGVGSLVGHRLIVLAYRDGRASDLAPLGYLELGLVIRDRLRRLLRGARAVDARRGGGDRCRGRPRIPRILDIHDVRAGRRARSTTSRPSRCRPKPPSTPYEVSVSGVGRRSLHAWRADHLPRPGRDPHGTRARCAAGPRQRAGPTITVFTREVAAPDGADRPVSGVPPGRPRLRGRPPDEPADRLDEAGAPRLPRAAPRPARDRALDTGRLGDPGRHARRPRPST